METQNTLSKDYLKSKYEVAPYGIIILSPDGSDIIYSNLAANVSLGCLLDGTNIQNHLCEGWQEILNTARIKRQTAFIPFKQQDIFTYLRVTPIIRNDEVAGFLGNTVNAVELQSTSLVPLEYIDDEGSFENLLKALEDILEECPHKETRKAVRRMYRNSLKLYNHRRDYVDFITQNYFLMKEEKTVFTLLSLLTLVSKNAFRIELSKTATMKADTLYVKGVFELYRIMIEQVIYFMLSQTNDPSPITADVDFCNGRINMVFFKRGTNPKGHSRMRRTNEGKKPNPPLIQLMEPILSASKVTVKFDTTENIIVAEIGMDYVTGNCRPQYEEDNVTAVVDSSDITDITDYDSEEYEDYYID